MPVQATPWWGATTSLMKRCGGGAQFMLQLQQGVSQPGNIAAHPQAILIASKQAQQ